MVLQKVWIYRLNKVGHRLIIRKNKKKMILQKESMHKLIVVGGGLTIRENKIKN